MNIEALASEVAARFWFADGKPDFGRVYLEKALHAYDIWGAAGKAEDLRTEFGVGAPRHAQESVTAGSTTAGTAERSDALDLATVLKASQAISGEIVLDRLLATLLDIIVENAGAESAVLALENENEHLIQGMKSAGEKARVMMAEPLRHSVAVSKGIVNYVIRTSEHVVLADPALRGKFRNDPYVRNRHPKSVLCAPVSHKGKLDRDHLPREQPGLGRVHAESPRGAEHPARADRRLHRERDALREAGAADARDRGRERHAHEGSRRSQARRARARASIATTSRSSSRSARRSSRTRRAGSSTCRGARAWPRSRPACCTTSAT